LPDDLNRAPPKHLEGRVKLLRLEAEADEMWSFVGCKANKQWVWLALDVESKQIIAFYVGDRSRRSARKLWQRIPALYQQHATFSTGGGHACTRFAGRCSQISPRHYQRDCCMRKCSRRMSCTRTRGEKSTPHKDPCDPPRRRANKRKGHGTYETDRPPIFSIVGRQSGVVRYFVRHHADAATCLAVVKSTVPQGSTILYTDEWKGYLPVADKLQTRHATVRHSPDAEGGREWARDDDGDGVREVHCNSCEGAGTGLRTFLREFRGVHKKHLADYVATYETMSNAKRITSAIVHSMCFVTHHAHSGDT